MSYIVFAGKNNKPQIAKSLAFRALLNGKIPNKDTNISELFTQFDNAIKEIHPKITTSALSNAHGDWYEWLLAIESWNLFLRNPNSHLVLLLPNVAQFDVSKLYQPSLVDLINDLKEKLLQVSQVRLITSNPDFVIIDGKLARSIIIDQEPIDSFSEDTLTMLGGYYNQFINQCDFNQIIGFISVKASLRPDRRLQIPHEGSLMKAIYTHLQTRQWIINPPGLKYYAITTKLTKPDKEALKTVATHSITTVSSLPQAAVDDVFEVNSLAQASDALEKILLPG